MPKKELVFVLGMGRSGTSLLTRVLSLCGASLPDRLFGPAEGNPTGHWEPLAALELNEAFLARFQSSWYDPTFRLQDEGAIAGPERESFVGQIYDFLLSCPAASLLVVKEPRITALFEFWRDAATRAGFTVKIAIPIRHPREVAASLAARDGVSPELSDVLWLKYNLLAERNSRSFPRVFVDYPRLVKDWRAEVTRIITSLALPSAQPDEASIGAFVTAELYHQRAEERPGAHAGSAWLGDVYAALSAATGDEFFDARVLDDVFRALRGSEHLFRTAVDEFHERFQVRPG